MNEERSFVNFQGLMLMAHFVDGRTIKDRFFPCSGFQNVVAPDGLQGSPAKDEIPQGIKFEKDAYAIHKDDRKFSYLFSALQSGDKMKREVSEFQPLDHAGQLFEMSRSKNTCQSRLPFSYSLKGFQEKETFRSPKTSADDGGKRRGEAKKGAPWRCFRRIGSEEETIVLGTSQDPYSIGRSPGAQHIVSIFFRVHGKEPELAKDGPEQRFQSIVPSSGPSGEATVQQKGWNPVFTQKPEKIGPEFTFEGDVQMGPEAAKHSPEAQGKIQRKRINRDSGIQLIFRKGESLRRTDGQEKGCPRKATPHGMESGQSPRHFTDGSGMEPDSGISPILGRDRVPSHSSVPEGGILSRFRFQVRKSTISYCIHKRVIGTFSRIQELFSSFVLFFCCPPIVLYFIVLRDKFMNCLWPKRGVTAFTQIMEGATVRSPLFIRKGQIHCYGKGNKDQ